MKNTKKMGKLSGKGGLFFLLFFQILFFSFLFFSLNEAFGAVRWSGLVGDVGYM